MRESIPLIHPQLQPAARMMPPLTFSRRNLWLIRFFTSIMPASRAPRDVSIENVYIPGQDGAKIRLRVYKPQDAHAPLPALLWLHGGGYVIGKPEMNDRRCCAYAREVGITVVSVDYRLAPEHPFPAALEDSYAALQWLAADAGDLGMDAARIAIGGGSAGGGLAAALTQMARDRGEIRPVFQLLVYPMLDDRTVQRTDLNGRSYLAWDPPSNRFGWESYLGGHFGSAELPAYAAPARRADLSGLPPAWIGVGSLDLFHVEGVSYARRLQESGTACALHVVEGAFHGFDVNDPRVPVVRDFHQSQVEALKKHLLSAEEYP